MKRITMKSLTVLAVLGGLQTTQASVWKEQNQWDSNWEEKYSYWIQTSFNEDFFTAGKYKGIPTDCADAVYAARAVFAFENKLPFVIQDPTGGSSKISNNMSRFDGTKDEVSRFKLFVNYISDLVSTKSLPNDSYPVAINRENVRSGTIWSRPRITKSNIFSRIFGGTVKEDPGHAEIVKNVNETGAIYLIGSTVPQDVRKLITTSSLVFMPVETSTGLRNWMQPNFYSQKNDNLPGFSMEQFSTVGTQQNNNSYSGGEGGGYNNNSSTRNLSTWSSDVQARLALRAENRDEAIQRQAANVCTLATARIELVRKADRFRAGLGGQCMNAENYDSYSTPSRDKRIAETLDSMATASGVFGFSLAQKVGKLTNFLNACPELEISEGKKISLADFSMGILSGSVSSNPNDSLENRWGIGTENKSTCPTY